MTATPEAADSNTLEIERDFAASPALLFRQWTESEGLRAWFAPSGYEVLSAAADPRPGGAWEVRYRSESGTVISEAGRFLVLEPPSRLVLTLQHRFADGRRGPETQITVSFADVDGRSRMRFVQTGIESEPMRDGLLEGWGSCFDQLDRRLAAAAGAREAQTGDVETEIRALFAAWWDESAAMDIDATMARIAPGVVSYEHQAPLVHRGREAVRASCQGGFDAMRAMGGAFRWEVEDLQIVARQDIAVAWGINIMRVTKDGTSIHESRSRGTWLFRRQDGEWQVMHQHFSYPVDPESGQALMTPQA
jgi:uncharacterized protein (TIGR02246 family)